MSPETVKNPHGGAGFKFPANDTTAAYPVYLERNDQRQDMKGVALTVVNVEALEKWFYEDYLDFQYDNRADNQNMDAFRVDATTGNPTKLVIYVSRTPTVAEAPGWAGYTVDGGPPYPYYARPNLPMTCPAGTTGCGAGMINQGTEILQAIKIWNTKGLVCPTTIVSDNPVYVEGDFNVGDTYPTMGCAVIGDIVTLLSKRWDSTALKRRKPAGGQTRTSTIPLT